MNQSMLSVRVDSTDKQDFEEFCKEAGINISTAINMFIKAVLREQRIPFEIKTKSFDEEAYEKLLEAENSNSETYSKEEVIESLKQIVENSKEDKRMT